MAKMLDPRALVSYPYCNSSHGRFKDPQVIPTCSQVWNHFPVCYLHVSETLRKDLQCNRIQIENEIGSEEERTMRKEDDEAKG